MTIVDVLSVCIDFISSSLMEYPLPISYPSSRLLYINLLLEGTKFGRG